MATVATTIPTIETEGDQLVVMDGVSWTGYAAFLRLRGERSRPKVVYLDGRLSLMSPGFAHERMKTLLRVFIEIALGGLGIQFVPAGSTTLRHKRKRGGVEGDETYYLRNLEVLRGKKRLDLRVDPPPDLAVEVVVSHAADDAVEVYRRFGVPEVWVCTETGLTFLLLDERGDYAASETGLAIPGLTADEARAWIVRDDFPGEIEWRRAIRRWVAEELAPRRDRRKGEAEPRDRD